MKKLDFIDSLRGIAILLVIMVHVSQITNDYYPDKIQSIFNFGSKGVQLFFICSAFTIFLSFDHRRKTDKYPILFFYIRRFFRIAPFFYLAIIYYLFQDGFGPRFWLGDQKSITIGNIISTFSFTNSFNPYWINSIVPGGWSIAIEMIFYLFSPLLFRLIDSSKKILYYILLSIPFSYFFNKILLQHQLISDGFLWQEFTYFNFINQFYYFLLGISMYFMFKDKNEWKKTIINNSMFFIIIIGIIIITDIRFFYDYKVIYGLIFISFFISLSLRKNIIFNNVIFRGVGKTSFSIYLLHFALIHWICKFKLTNIIDKSLLNFIILYFIVVFFSFILSILTKKYIEDKFQKIGEKLIIKLSK